LQIYQRLQQPSQIEDTNFSESIIVQIDERADKIDH